MVKNYLPQPFTWSWR